MKFNFNSKPSVKRKVEEIIYQTVFYNLQLYKNSNESFISQMITSDIMNQIKGYLKEK